ncbi:MAG TPA: hypothetical protein VE870_14960 [Bacteroidales bacterium]|nr:hypothetical protein [Bacteroidales bacterium]
MVQIGDIAPDFTGQDVVNNTPYTLSHHFGKVIVLAFVGWT